MTLLTSSLEHLAADIEQALQTSQTQRLQSSLDRLCAWLKTTREPVALAEERILHLQSLTIKAAGLLEKSLALSLQRVGEYLLQTSHFTLAEAAAAEVAGDSRILFVGGGALPVSPLCLARHFDCQVTSLDWDLRATSLAHATLERLAPDCRLEVRWGNLSRCDLAAYTHCWIASLVDDKASHLRRILRANPGIQAVVRYANDYRRIFNYSLPQEALAGWRVRRSLAEPGQLHDTVVVQSR
ncbi:MAG: hypothetical protein KF760_09125 [Candidatus Eremiobacteraeota bacterium]|nr:hypothetical protein [Candidatus Eremiobacteraeota bacterium]MCW5869382.1 hypothetical protein [Candidatus Eremiobacteraeota bacterium]